MCNCEVLRLCLIHSREPLEDCKEGFPKAQSGGGVENDLERDKAEDRKIRWGHN